MKRQKFRKLLLLISLLLFPVTLYYFSPVLIIGAGLEGIINGSFIVFTAMLVLSAFFGRLFCGYVCPGGGIQECAFEVNDKAPKQGWRNNIKYVIWILWIAVVIICYINRKRSITVNFFWQTEYGISVSEFYIYAVYYGIVLLIILPALLFGKRIFCHYFCWMAPFMVIGSRIGKILRIPQLQISAESEKCTSCGKCSKVCPMSLDVKNMVESGKINDDECILCGMCADKCPKKVLNYTMKIK